MYPLCFSHQKRILTGKQFVEIFRNNPAIPGFDSNIWNASGQAGVSPIQWAGWMQMWEWAWPRFDQQDMKRESLRQVKKKEIFRILFGEF